jgi:hypothetical protein
MPKSRRTLPRTGASRCEIEERVRDLEFIRKLKGSFRLRISSKCIYLAASDRTTSKVPAISSGLLYKCTD